MNIGDHLVAGRTGYSHHGLYIGHDEVIHYSGFADGISTGEISITTLDEFANGRDVFVKNHPFRFYDADESVERAYQRLGEDWYNVLLNNCEHFVNWCVNGLHQSEQINNAVSAISAAYNILNEDKKRQTVQALAGFVTNSMVQKEIERQVVQAIAPSVVKSIVSTSASMAAGASVVSGSGVATTALMSSFVATSAAPIVAPVVVAVAVGYGVKKVIDWLWD